MQRPNGTSVKPCCRGHAHYWKFVGDVAAGSRYRCVYCKQSKVILPYDHRWDWREVPYIHPHPMHQGGGDVAGIREYLGGLVRAQREYHF